MGARREYRDRLVALEDALLRAGDGYRVLLGRAMTALLAADVSAAHDVVLADDALDELAAYVRDEALELVALQSPVAGELRLLSAVLHIDLLLERVGELAVNLARSASADDPDESDPLVRQLAEMGEYVDRLLTRALEHLARRRRDVSELEALDDDLDRLRRTLHEDLVRTAVEQPRRTEWAIRTALAASWLERAGDLAVGVARQVRFLVTGQPELRR